MLNCEVVQCTFLGGDVLKSDRIEGRVGELEILEDCHLDSRWCLLRLLKKSKVMWGKLEVRRGEQAETQKAALDAPDEQVDSWQVVPLLEVTIGYQSREMLRSC